MSAIAPQDSAFLTGIAAANRVYRVSIAPAKPPEFRWYTYAIFAPIHTGSTQHFVLNPEKPCSDNVCGREPATWGRSDFHG